MLIRWAEIYENTEVLSPIDRKTWETLALTCGLDNSSRVIELASGKGAFAVFLARNCGCRVEGFDHNPEFIEYSNQRAKDLGQEGKLSFTKIDVNHLEVKSKAYDAGVCLGALYIFRESGWNVLTRSVKPGGYLAVSDLVCKEVPAPKEVMEIFFKEPGEPLTLDDARRWYESRGATILREITCSRAAWLDYYNLQKEMLMEISKRKLGNRDLQLEVEEELRQDLLVRKYREEYMDYVTFIMRMT